MVSTVKKHLVVSIALLLLCNQSLLFAADATRTPTPEEFRERVKQYNQGGIPLPGQNVRPPQGFEQFRRAVMLHSKKDASAAELKEAAKLYQEAVAAGNAQAQVNLALMYLDGKGVKKDVKKSLSLLNDAVKKGEPQADVALARLYLTGKDVKMDEKKGEFHLSRAAKSGNQAAVKMLADYKDWKKKNELAMKQYQEALKQAQQNQAVSRVAQQPLFPPQVKPSITLKDLQKPATAELPLPLVPGYAYIGTNPLFSQQRPQLQAPAADKGTAAPPAKTP